MKAEKMTANERALKILTEDTISAQERVRARDIAILAIEKQIPKKPEIKSGLISEYFLDTVERFYCPECGKSFSDLLDDGFGKFTCCPWCGQRIDWSDVKL